MFVFTPHSYIVMATRMFSGGGS